MPAAAYRRRVSCLSGGGRRWLANAARICASGEEAITLLQSGKSDYRALITDINLQGILTGWDVAKRARELNPEISVVYMTGQAADQWPSHGVPKSSLLNKPFAPASISHGCFSAAQRYPLAAIAPFSLRQLLVLLRNVRIRPVKAALPNEACC